jgi:hypothetical protein
LLNKRRLSPADLSKERIIAVAAAAAPRYAQPSTHSSIRTAPRPQSRLSRPTEC